jgi:hypothetical protein
MENNKTGLWIVMSILALLLGACATGLVMLGNEKVITVEKPVLVNVATPYNDSAIIAKIEAIQLTVQKDDTWKDQAIALAKADLESKSYKDLYNALVDLNISIDEKSDIESVIYKDVKVVSFDVDEKDATVNFELKVYYENSDGDSKKVSIDASAVIEDADIEDFEYELA